MSHDSLDISVHGNMEDSQIWERDEDGRERPVRDDEYELLRE